MWSQVLDFYHSFPSLCENAMEMREPMFHLHVGVYNYSCFQLLAMCLNGITEV